MTRMTQSISLALIGSSLILAGCGRPAPLTAEEKAKEEEKEREAGGVAGRHHGGIYHHPVIIPGSRSPATSGSHGSGFHAPSRSGGFGSSGHMVGS